MFDEEEVRSQIASYDTALIQVVSRSPSPAHTVHAAESVESWANEGAASRFANLAPGVVFEPGDMFVKTHHDESGERVAVFAMVKREPGYDTNAGGWWWANLGPDASLEVESGALAFCADCHQQWAPDTDLVLGIE